MYFKAELELGKFLITYGVRERGDPANVYHLRASLML